MTLITLNFNCLTAINEFRVPELSIKIHLIPSITAISHLPHQLSTSPAHLLTLFALLSSIIAFSGFARTIHHRPAVPILGGCLPK